MFVCSQCVLNTTKQQNIIDSYTFFVRRVSIHWWQGRRHVDGGIDFNVTLELDSYYKISLKKVPKNLFLLIKQSTHQFKLDTSFFHILRFKHPSQLRFKAYLSSHHMNRKWKILVSVYFMGM